MSPICAKLFQQSPVAWNMEVKVLIVVHDIYPNALLLQPNLLLFSWTSYSASAILASLILFFPLSMLLKTFALPISLA